MQESVLSHKSFITFPLKLWKNICNFGEMQVLSVDYSRQQKESTHFGKVLKIQRGLMKIRGWDNSMVDVMHPLLSIWPSVLNSRPNKSVYCLLIETVFHILSILCASKSDLCSFLSEFPSFTWSYIEWTCSSFFLEWITKCHVICSQQLPLNIHVSESLGQS